MSMVTSAGRLSWCGTGERNTANALNVGDRIRVLRKHHRFDTGSVITLIRLGVYGSGEYPEFMGISTRGYFSDYFNISDRSGWERVTDDTDEPRKTAHELQDEEVGIPSPLDEVIDTSPEHVEIAEENRHMQPSTAQGFLEAALETLNQRGKDYDKPAGERSAASVATAFNAITGRNVTEQEVWLILQLVKDVRQWQQPDRYHADSALDSVAYAALKAEALASRQ